MNLTHIMATGIGGMLAAAAFASSAAAQDAPQNGVLVVYGNQKCPTDSNGNEIVVCQHRNAGEQFRIPKELRELKVTPDNKSWAARDQDAMAAGDSGIGSCSVSGVGGATGCFAQEMRRAKAERQAKAKADADVPR